MTKISSKIDKRTHTRLSKLNAKHLLDEIESVKSDLIIEADWLINYWDTENKYLDGLSKEHTDTINYWQKEIKAAFRIFRSTKVKLDKAYRNGIKK